MTEALPGLHHLRAHPGGRRGQSVIGSSVSRSGGSGLVELSVRLDLSMGFQVGGLAFSLSVAIVIGGGMTPISASDAEEKMRAACEAVRGRTDECGGTTWTGYGDS